jgi:hypothetical protein
VSNASTTETDRRRSADGTHDCFGAPLETRDSLSANWTQWLGCSRCGFRFSEDHPDFGELLRMPYVTSGLETVVRAA